MSLRPRVERREGAIPDTTARAIAARLERAAARARERGLDLDAVADMQGEALALLAALYPEEARLLATDHSGKFQRMVTAERVRHSKGSTGDDPFRAAVNASHFTIRSLAEKLGVSHAHLSQARRGQTSIAKALAEEIQRLTGFAATKHNWPRLKG